MYELAQFALSSLHVHLFPNNDMVFMPRSLPTYVIIVVLAIFVPYPLKFRRVIAILELGSASFVIIFPV